MLDASHRDHVVGKMFDHAALSFHDDLPGTKFVLATVGRKPERHGISCNSLPVHQLHLVHSHDFCCVSPSSDRMRSAPAISMSKRKRNVPAHVGSRSQQQNQPPSHKYGAHPQLVAPDAKSFGKRFPWDTTSLVSLPELRTTALIVCFIPGDDRALMVNSWK